MKIPCALLVLFASAAVAGPHRHDVQQAWKDACRLSRYDCKGLKPPRVVMEPSLKWFMYLGQYDGNIVTLQPDLEPDVQHLTLTHEFVHHLQQVHGAIQLPYKSHKQSCWSEQEAWQVWDRLALELGRKDQLRPNWAENYACTPEDLK